MTPTVDADYLVVGAGAAGLAFTDALVDHSDASVIVVDRRDRPGGHWREAYPFVRLHQASQFYGVASMQLGHGELQRDGPEAGLHERATGAEVCAYYDAVAARLAATDRVDFRWGTMHDGGGRLRSLKNGETRQAGPGCRIVDAHRLSPTIPADTPPPFAVHDAVRVVPVGDLPAVTDAARFVVVGSGKTATDAIVWLLGRGTPPDAICWVRPRDPWMLNRAVVQPEPAVFHGMVADTLEAAEGARSLDELFLRLEDAGVMLRIDRSHTPTMAKAPTLATWELELLRTVEDVVRAGHIRAVGPGRLRLDRAERAIPREAVIVHCAADGLPRPDLVPVWGEAAITLQPVRAGFPTFGAALIGYVEATRRDDAAKNATCRPVPYGNTLAQWADMTVRGARSQALYLAEPDIAAWAATVPLNPARVPPGYASQALDDARARIAQSASPGLARLAELAG